MPPSPIVTATINEPVYTRLIAELDIPRPITKIKHVGDKDVQGLFHAPNLIYLYLGFDEYDTDQLRYVSKELSRALLHETRHAWQLAKHGYEWFDADSKLPYAQRREEIDANEFESSRIHDYRGLVKVTRRFPSTQFSRLAKTEQLVRHAA